MFISNQVIHCEIKFGDTSWYSSFLYAYNCGIEKRQLQRQLELLKEHCEDLPWLLIGDFNVVESMEEKSRGEKYSLTMNMSLVNVCISLK